LLKTVLQEQFFQYGPSFEGIELLSRTIMTGNNCFRNSEIDIAVNFLTMIFRTGGIRKKSGVRK